MKPKGIDASYRLLALQYMYASLMLSPSELVFYPLMIGCTTRLFAASHSGFEWICGKACECCIVVDHPRPSSYMVHGASTAKVLSTAEMSVVKIKTSLEGGGW